MNPGCSWAKRTTRYHEYHEFVRGTTLFFFFSYFLSDTPPVLVKPPFKTIISLDLLG